MLIFYGDQKARIVSKTAPSLANWADDTADLTDARGENSIYAIKSIRVRP